MTDNSARKGARRFQKHSMKTRFLLRYFSLIFMFTISTSIIFLWVVWISISLGETDNLLASFLKLSRPDSLAAFGDSFGALNALLSAFAVFGLFISLILQSRQIRETQLELEEQRQLRRIDQFDRKFLIWINAMHDIWLRSGVDRAAADRLPSGFLGLLSEAILEIDQSDLSESERKRYAKILRASLSPVEKTLILQFIAKNKKLDDLASDPMAHGIAKYQLLNGIRDEIRGNDDLVSCWKAMHASKS
ncbi:MAG: hypothetical protein ACU0B7_10675 [Paracoccaceae bacterium]